MSPPTSAPEPVPAWLQAWPRQTQCALAGLLTLLLVVLGVAAYRSTAYRPLELQKAGAWSRIDLNRADLEQLRSVPGIDEVLARRILEYRQARGGFKSVDELDQVKGIGPTTLARARPYLHVASAPAASPETPPSDLRNVSAGAVEMPPRPMGRKQPPASPLDLNSASAEQLAQVPGLGPVLAQRIVEARNARPFGSVDDLRRVRGIGPATLEKVRPHVTVTPRPEA